MTVVGVVLAIGLPALLFTAWPLIRRSRGRSFLAVPPDPREQLMERKRQILTALRELDFEHEAGHVGDDDYAELNARYETEAGEILTALDHLGVRQEKEARERSRRLRIRTARAAVTRDGVRIVVRANLELPWP